MKRFALVAVVIAIGSLAVTPALAQGKDPFLPPNSGPAPAPGSGGAGAPGSGAFEPPPVSQEPGNGLARTGQDVGGQFGIAVALVSLGGGLRLAARVTSSSGPRMGRVRPASG